MAYNIKLSRTDSKILWDAVRQIIRDNHEMIINKSTSLRDSQYIVRDILSKDYLPAGRITQKMFDLFVGEDQAYVSFTQDIWTQLEREGFQRPKPKPLGIFYWMQESYTIEKISAIIPQLRGFIYVEKEGIAEKLKELSDYGWGVVASQGQATREIRELIKGTNKPCLIIHDFDPDGEIISEAIINKTRRTTHLDIANNNAVDFLLNEEQTDFLLENYNVATQPLPNKWRGKWKKDYRIELSAFVIIKESENPVLDFVKAEMKRLGFPLSLLPLPNKDLFKEKVGEEIKWQIEYIVEKLLEDHEVEGYSCKARLLEGINIRNDKKVISIIRNAIDKVKGEIDWTSEEDMEAVALGGIPNHWIERRPSHEN